MDIMSVICFTILVKKKSWFDIKTPEMEMSKMIVWLDI